MAISSASVACWVAATFSALFSVTALAAKPGGSEPSPCVGAESRGFPSFGFNRQSTSKGQINWEYRLADSAGTCEQLAWSRAWTSRYSDVFFRYDAGSRSGIALGSVGTDFSLVASTFSVTFDADGKPTVAAPQFQVILTLDDLAARPPPLDLTGWQINSMGSARISPSGTSFLVTSYDRDISTAVYWQCSLAIPVDATSCTVVYYASAADEPYVNWGATDSTLHVVRSATSGSGSSLYVVDLESGTAEEVYGRGTLLTASKAIQVPGLDGTPTERVVVHEAGPTVCDALNIVFDLDTCIENDCLVINGAGHRGGAMTWLPDGRVAQNGISKRGSSCSGSGTINAFDPVSDLNGSVTTLTTGQDPDGAGGG